MWLPTGTVANHLAVRMLAGEKRRVLVQHESHLHNDCGDCAETLSGLHLIGSLRARPPSPWRRWSGAGRDAMPAGWRCRWARYRSKRRCGATRRALRPPGDKKVSASRRAGAEIGLHLDGARLFLESAYTGSR